ncbi:hypothetical protein VQ042_20215 [Aurantimonas sp. A2-1-M11]|uniref:hypothetical protein n=1 Tax=Aurantimonas sp. A2-1-M11 TaxID=3113712 RepID=UPI002F9597D0
MAILDESVPRDLVAALVAERCQVVPFPNGWKGLKNGMLLDRLEAEGYAALVTCDRTMRFQQAIAKRSVDLVVLPDQRLARLLPIARNIGVAVGLTSPGEVILVDASGRADVVSHRR